MTSFTKRNLLVLALYTALALVLTYPLVLHFGDAVPGTTTWSMDEYGYVWNNWWFKHAVLDLGTNPFQTNYLFYPLGTSLVLYTFTLLHVLLGLPIQLLYGLVPASNAELLFAFVISGYGAFLLVRYLFKTSGLRFRSDTLAAFAAGALFAFSSNRFVYASLGHYNVVATEWIPFYILFLVKTVREAAWRNAVLAGLFAALALYVETTDGVLLALFTLVYLLVTWRAVLHRRVLARLAAAVVCAALLFAPLLIPTLSEILNSGYTLPGWGHAEKLLVDLFGFVTPTGLNIFNRRWVEELDQVRQATSRFVDVNTVFVGYVTLLLALLSAIRYWRTLKAWAISAVVFAILSLGPLLHINGRSTFDLDGLQVTFPLPFLLLHYIPLFRENRVPNRFSVLLMLSLAVLVGFAIAWTSERFQAKSQKWSLLLPFALVLLLLLEHASFPLPLTDSRVPDVYAQIGHEPGNSAVLTLPLGWRNSFGQQGAEDTRTQYYQSVHQKYIFPGNIQRNPPFLFDYFDRISLFHSLTELEFYHDVPDEVLARDRAAAPGLMAFFDVRYLVVQPAIPGRPPYSDTRNAVLDYARQVLPLGDKIYDRDGVVAYRIDQPPLPSKLEIPFGTEAAGLYQAEGWDRAEVVLDAPANWANSASARILFPAREPGAYSLILRALPFTYPRSPVQTMQVEVNGHLIEKTDMKPGWQDYVLTIPASAVHSGINDLVLRFSYTVRPRDVQPSSPLIGKTEIASPVDIVVNSGTLGSIKVNGRETSLLGRGYNVVVLDPTSGAVTGAKVFNTADDRSQSRALTDYIARIPAGSIVALASQEDVAANLGDGTVAVLRSLGAQIDIRQNPVRSHAIIGVKGAAAGTALEQSNDGSAFIYVGHVPDDRTLSAAVSSVIIEKR